MPPKVQFALNLERYYPTAARIYFSFGRGGLSAKNWGHRITAKSKNEFRAIVANVNLFAAGPFAGLDRDEVPFAFQDFRRENAIVVAHGTGGKGGSGFDLGWCRLHVVKGLEIEPNSAEVFAHFRGFVAQSAFNVGD